jgi:hypothetical protein
VHNVVSSLKLCCAFEVDLRLAKDWVGDLCTLFVLIGSVVVH